MHSNFYKEMFKMINKQQSYAIKIEAKIRKEFQCDREQGAFADSDFARKQPFTALLCILTHKYSYIDKNDKEKIDSFIVEFSEYANLRIDDLLNDDKESELQKMIRFID